MAESHHLLVLPPELLHDIFKWLEPRDLGRLPRTCRFLCDYISGNTKLFKDVYLNNLGTYVGSDAFLNGSTNMASIKDTPQHQDVEWQQQLQNLVRLQIICATENTKPNATDLPFVYRTITSLLRNASKDATLQDLADRQLKHAPSRNQWLLAHLFHDNDPARTAFFTKSSLFQRARRESVRPTRSAPTLPIAAADDAEAELRQQSAKLHCLYGRPILNGGRTRSSRMYPFACAKVYDLRQYTTASHWGPFRGDGSDRVDWEKVEAVLIVLGSNLRTTQSTSFSLHNVWDAPFAGSWSGSWVPTPARSLKGLDAEDPYGVSGTWLRVVSFIDYSDFFNYNFQRPDLSPELPGPPLDVDEAVRFIVMKIKVTAIEPPNEEDGQELPRVQFEGISRSLDDSWDENANSDLRVKGYCRLTEEGEVRWTTFSVFNGEERWRSESVQVGGVRSTRGVFGNWFDANFDQHGPAGPTAFWKMSDPREQDEGGDTVVLHDFLSIVEGLVDLSDEEFDGDYVMGEYGEEDDDDVVDEDEEREAMKEDLEALAQAEGDVEIIDLTAAHPGHVHGQSGQGQ